MAEQSSIVAWLSPDKTVDTTYKLVKTFAVRIALAIGIHQHSRGSQKPTPFAAGGILHQTKSGRQSYSPTKFRYTKPERRDSFGLLPLL
jgi:hypothetical protein